jgi:hypothetical protein
MDPKEQIVLTPDPVIEVYKKDIDRTLLRENLKLTVEERLQGLMRMHELYDELQRTRRPAR